MVIGNHEQYMLTGKMKSVHPAHAYGAEQMGGFRQAFGAAPSWATGCAASRWWCGSAVHCSPMAASALQWRRANCRWPSSMTAWPATGVARPALRKTWRR